MDIHCPYCQAKIVLRRVKPGRFTPVCSRCHKGFVLTVAADNTPQVSTLENETPPKSEDAGPPSTAAPRMLQHADEPAKTDKPAPRPEPPVPHSDSDLTGKLGGYEITRKLGEGGMGAVYLARQISLNRPVAVKVINPVLARDPVLVARFTREAYAAAQLAHHNIVQIYDLGLARDAHFFSMEFVPGKNLASVVRTERLVDPDVAAGFALQAARGLKFAHDHGLIHRDVKPENLLLNDEGIVKVADLGLVKTPEFDEFPPGAAATEHRLMGAAARTQINSALGTPQYMSPEQARDAAHVDARADVYSLGCTLYDLVTGHPPFDGKTAAEIIGKHAREPTPSADAAVKSVPHTLAGIISKMLAKDPAQRFDSMGTVIRVLESYLGMRDPGLFNPRREQAEAVEQAADKFNAAPAATLRGGLILAFLIVVPLGAIAATIFGLLLLAGGLIGLVFFAVVAYQFIAGVMRGTTLASRFRALIFGARIIDWLKALAGVAFAVFLLWLFGQLWVWLGFALIAIGLACVVAFVLDLMVKKQRRPILNGVAGLLKTLRGKGVSEDSVRHFVCIQSGRHWEELYETLFGYDAKIEAREAWGRGETGRARPKFAAWRDGLIGWADARIVKRKEAGERRIFELVETRGLEAGGLEPVAARRKAKERADAFVTQAAVLREERRQRDPDAPAPKISVRLKEPTPADAAEMRRERERLIAARTLGGRTGRILLGPHVRFALGAILLVLFFMWLKQNEALRPERVTAILNDQYNKLAKPRAAHKPATAPAEREAIPAPAASAPAKDPARPPEPLVAPFVPKEISAKLFNTFALGFAGILLLISSLWRGAKISLLLIPAAAVMVAGPLMGIPELGAFPAALVSGAIGLMLALLGFLVGRERG